jgi:hypothetical protein
MADAGATRIQQLLETPSAAFAGPANDLQGELVAADPQEGTVPSTSFDSIEALRTAFGGLARQIAAIQTSSAGPKGEALAALKRLDAGLADFSSGLEEATGEGAQVAFESAQRRVVRAASDLRRASERIA